MHCGSFCSFEKPGKTLNWDLQAFAFFCLHTMVKLTIWIIYLSVPPELIPSGQTAFTAPVGNSAVLELFIWAYPSPVPTSKMHESYSTPIRMNRCGESIDVTHNAEGISYIWYKVNPEGTASTLLVSSRVSENQFPVDGSRSPIWSDVILVNLASIFTQQVYALPVNREGQGQDKQKDNITSTPVPIPTLVYRLIFDQVHEFDYGEYICEIEHWSGKRTFLTKLQPPGMLVLNICLL